jgi:hypothetical protein
MRTLCKKIPMRTLYKKNNNENSLLKKNRMRTLRKQTMRTFVKITTRRTLC